MIAMKQKPKRGRPPKAESGKWQNMMYFRANDATRAAVQAYRDREGMIGDSEAIRALVIKALRNEGILPGT